MWFNTVIEREQKVGPVSVVRNGKRDDNGWISMPCWNILFQAPEKGIDKNLDPISGFDACLAWIRENKEEGSKYVILKMYFVDWVDA